MISVNLRSWTITRPSGWCDAHGAGFPEPEPLHQPEASPKKNMILKTFLSVSE